MMPNQPCSSCGRTNCPHAGAQRRSLPPCTQIRSMPAEPSAQTRPAAPCPCSPPSQKQLLLLITLTGFAALDSGMYLDTHPDDQEALHYFHDHIRRYNEAMDNYAKAFGPLTLSHATHNQEYWDWINQPWPWE